LRSTLYGTDGQVCFLDKPALAEPLEVVSDAAALAEEDDAFFVMSGCAADVFLWLGWAVALGRTAVAEHRDVLGVGKVSAACDLGVLVHRALDGDAAAKQQARSS
jgi:hypothetical protein